MKKRNRNLRILIFVIIGLAAYVWLVFASIWTDGNPFREIFKIFGSLIRPSAPHSTAYLDSDFMVLLSPVHTGSIPLGKVIFYKVSQNGDVKRTCEIKHCGPEIERPTRVDNTFYFPHGSALFHPSVKYVTVLRNGRVYRKNINCSSSENIVSLDGKIFVLTTCKKQLKVFDKNMVLLKEADLSDAVPEGFIGFYLYEHNGSLWVMGNDRDYGDKNFQRIFLRIDPATLKAVETIRFPYPLALDGDHGKLVRYNGKIYVLGNDNKNFRPYTCMHDVIYVLDPLPKPVYVSPYEYYVIDQSKPDKNFGSCLKRYESQKFKFDGASQFIPINPGKKRICNHRPFGQQIFCLLYRQQRVRENPEEIL